MNIFNDGNLKLAIQKDGRLTGETLAFLRKAGLQFESGKLRLYSSCRNFPLEIIYVRDNDIPNYVSCGIVDLGIVGQNILNEKRPQVKKLLNLRFGFCSLVLAVPRQSPIKAIKQLRGQKIATAYPRSTESYFKKQDIEVTIVKLSGSVEVAPFLGIADGISDLTSTGNTLARNNLRVLTKIYDSEAVLITNGKIRQDGLNLIMNKLVTSFQGVLLGAKSVC